MRLLSLVVIVAVMRLSNFVAGLTNTNPATTAPVYKQYRYVQYNGTVGLGANVSVSFPPTADKFRYVIIQNQFEDNETLCLSEVKVFLRGTHVIIAVAPNYDILGLYNNDYTD